MECLGVLSPFGLGRRGGDQAGAGAAGGAGGPGGGGRSLLLPLAVVDNSIAYKGVAFQVKERVRCLCEGGSYCRREDPALCPPPLALPGLHSSWVGPDVVAMARPTERGLKGGLLAAMAAAGVAAVVNLQESGEHAHCGAGLAEGSAFSYLPETVMRAGISHLNYPFPDMTFPSFETTLKIVQMMGAFVEKGGKVAVHCHAGLGRTGCIIACHFVHAKGWGPQEAVRYVREHRVGSLQTNGQVKFVGAFSKYLRLLRTVFSPAALPRVEADLLAAYGGAGFDAVEFYVQQGLLEPVTLRKGREVLTVDAVHVASVEDIVQLQRQCLFGADARKRFRHFPLVLHKLYEALAGRADRAAVLHAAAAAERYWCAPEGAAPGPAGAVPAVPADLLPKMEVLNRSDWIRIPDFPVADVLHLVARVFLQAAAPLVAPGALDAADFPANLGPVGACVFERTVELVAAFDADGSGYTELARWFASLFLHPADPASAPDGPAGGGGRVANLGALIERQAAAARAQAATLH